MTPNVNWFLDFHVSGPRDHNRETIRAKTNSENVKQQFKFKTMFSELRHHPRYETVFQQTDPVPGFINRNWADRTQLPREESNVGGSDRFKYFRRPVVPYSQAPVDVILEPQKPQIIEEEDTGKLIIYLLGVIKMFRNSSNNRDANRLPRSRIADGSILSRISSQTRWNSRNLDPGCIEAYSRPTCWSCWSQNDWAC